MRLHRRAEGLDLPVAGVDGGKAGDRAQQGRLARAGRADQGDHLAAADAQRDPVQGAARAEGLGDAAEREERRRRTAWQLRAVPARRRGLQPSSPRRSETFDDAGPAPRQIASPRSQDNGPLHRRAAFPMSHGSGGPEVL